jgi:YgiT-type zinc finger domain-containing protein
MIMTKKISCEECGSQNLKATRVTYPVNIPGKQINVQNVSAKQCQDCKAIMPTEAGQEKIARCMMSMLNLFHS